MILYRWRGETSNFGDELNTVLWPALLPGFFDDDPATRFLGIGSVLDRRHPAEIRKLVAGAAYGGYEGKPALDATWTVHWVRGPRTAATLGLPREIGLGDPAVLLPHAIEIKPAPSTAIGFMPHFESAARGAWQRAADIAGVTLIDPRGQPLDILAQIARCRVLLSEALHGIIVADTLRVPWVPIRPLARIHRPKWRDWADTVAVVPRFASLPPSALPEWLAARAGFATCHGAGIAAERMIARAARALERAARAEPQLSPDAALQQCQSRQLDALAALRRNPGCVAPGARRWCLRNQHDSPYELQPIG
nr:polysaccharide pyruvyl transferase family protein [uncultured Rhodopila sp.]